MATSTFRLGLSQDSELRDLLTMQPPESIHQLKRQIEEYNRLEDDQQQSKGKAPATSHYVKDSRSGGFQSRPRREIRIQEPNTQTGEINVTFKKPVQNILEMIKNESYF